MKVARSVLRGVGRSNAVRLLDALDSIEAVDKLYQAAKHHKLTIIDEPKTFGIGTRSFSVRDPDGIEVEFTYHPPMWDEA